MLRRDRTRWREDRLWAARTMAEIEARMALGRRGDLWADLAAQDRGTFEGRDRT